jgi:HSP20 family protein
MKVSEKIEHVRDLPEPLPWPARVWDWLEMPGFGRWFEGLRPWSGEEWRLRIEEELKDDTMVIRAELPGIDPDKDVEITVADGVLNLRAERRYEQTEEEKGRTRSEFRYGSFTRAVGVPRELSVEDVEASYTNGILEVRFPCKVPTEAEVRKVPITRS